MKKRVLEKFANFTGKHLSYDFFFKKQNVSCEYLELFKDISFEVENLENEIYIFFLMSEPTHSLLGKVKKVYQNSFTVKETWYSVTTLI